MIDPKAKLEVIAKGLPASPGAGVGMVVFDAARAEERASAGDKVILVRSETSPEDIGGMAAAQGILTERGGMTSHAAVVARGMGKCCIVGCSEISINEEQGTMHIGDKIFKDGDYISLDGTTGKVISGKVDLIEPELSGKFGILMSWADEVRTLKIRTNADTPNDAKIAREFGAEGIGLCRTEHMFFEGERILAMREMILSETRQEREKALAKILPMQRGDFKGIFEAMEGLPVTIRLFDPPLHEFLPHSYEELKEIGDDMGVPFDKIREKMNSLKELNPMLGHRGCRLGITYPSIYEMQVRAIMEAACEMRAEGKTVEPEIMIPLVGHVNELIYTKERVVAVAEAVMKEKGCTLPYKVGTMIELPRAAITADQIAKEAEFFSFGTNDLTQTTFGFSRDDVGNFLGFYLDNNILKIDPFVAIDRDGVGELIKIAVTKGRKVRPDIKLGICGEHGGEPSSIEFCHQTGLNYVSCSPYRVPVARLAAAQAKLKAG
jgi:pyruvate,orthophosphate dikinase